MGRRSRKKGVLTPRAGAPRPAPRAAPRPARPERPITATPDQRPKAPWHPLPVTEVAIFVGAVAMIVGFVQGRDGLPVTLVGMAVCGLAVLELSAREHFAGFRSHSLLLALGPVVALEAVLYALGLTGPVLLAIAVPLFVVLAYALRSRYKVERNVRVR